MEAYNRFNKCIFKWERTLLKLVGHDLLAPKLKPTIMTFVIYGAIVVSTIFVTYTFINYGLLEKCFSIHAISLAIQVKKYITKFSWILSLIKCVVWRKSSSMLRFDDFQWSTHFLQHIYKVHITTKNRDLMLYFHKFALFTELLFKLLLVLYFMACGLFLVYPVYMYFIQNELVPILPVYIIGVDENTTTGIKRQKKLLSCLNC